MLQKLALALAITSAFSLAGCGGGGGGSDDNKPLVCENGQVPNAAGDKCIDKPVVPPVCTDAQVLENGKCVDKPVDPVVCTDAQVLVDGKCVDKPVDPVCTDAQVLVDGKCVDKPVDPVCTDAQVLENGKCVDKPVEQTIIEVTAIDGYLNKAHVWLDCDADGERDNNEIQAETNASGIAKLDVTANPAAADCVVGVEAVAGYTIDMDAPTQTIATSYTLWAPAGSVSDSKALVTPFSSLVQFQVSNGSSLATAKTEAAALLGITEAQLDVDYIKLGMNENGAIAANLVQIFPKLDFVGDGGWAAGVVAPVVSDIATKVRGEFAKQSKESGDDRRKGITVVVDATGAVSEPTYVKPGEVACVDGQEKWNNRCVAVCAEGEQRNVNGVCEETTVVCTDGQVLEGDSCVTPVICSVLETKVDNTCVPKTCPEGQQLDASGECITTELVCNDNEVIEDGKCVVKPVVCEDGKELVNGECVVKPIVCEDGKELVNGKCVVKPVVCEDGKELVNGECVVKPIVCEDGKELVNGECVVKPIVCEDGKELVNGECVVKPIVCEDGKELVNGECVVKPIVCEDDEVLENGKCVPKPLECAEGQEKWNNTCVPVCADDEIRGNDGTCALIEECVIE